MTLESLINRLTQYASWLIYRQWTRWEVIAVVAAILVAMLLARAAKRRLRAAEKRLREHSPIVGIGLAPDKRH